MVVSSSGLEMKFGWEEDGGSRFGSVGSLLFPVLIYSLVMLAGGNMTADARHCGGMVSLWLWDYDKVDLMLRKLIGRFRVFNSWER